MFRVLPFNMAAIVPPRPAEASGTIWTDAKQFLLVGGTSFALVPSRLDSLI